MDLTVVWGLLLPLTGTALGAGLSALLAQVLTGETGAGKTALLSASSVCAAVPKFHSASVVVAPVLAS